MTSTVGWLAETVTDPLALLSWLGGAAEPAPVARCRADAVEDLWILAHCDDGVAWGCVRNGNIALACHAGTTARPPKPDARNLQQLRVFGSTGEVLVWRSDDSNGFSARLLRDDGEPTESDPTRPMNESVLVLGQQIVGHGENKGVEFVVLTDSTGRTHVPPLPRAASVGGHTGFRLVLDVRHFLDDDDNGVVRVVAGRLVRLRTLGKTEGRIEV